MGGGAVVGGGQAPSEATSAVISPATSATLKETASCQHSMTMGTAKATNWLTAAQWVHPELAGQHHNGYTQS